MIDSLQVAQPLAIDVVRAPHNWWDVVLTGVVAVGAALLGAHVGGQRAHEAALDVHRRTVQVEEHERRGRMFARIERTLIQIMAISDTLPKMRVDDIQFAATRADVRAIWESFAAHSVDLHLIGDRDFQSRLEAFVAGLYTVSVALDNELRDLDQMRMTEMLGSGQSGVSPSNIMLKYDPVKVLERGRDILKNMCDAGRGYLSELHQHDAATVHRGEHLGSSGQK